MVERKLIREWCRKNKCTPKFYGENPEVIVIGEIHTLKIHSRREEEIIALVKPEILLHESVGIRIYNHKNKEVTFQDRVPINRLDEFRMEDEIDRKLLQLADKYKLILVGIDLSCKELSLLEKLIEEEKPGFDIGTQSKEACFYRERRMGERIVQYSQKTKKPIVTIVGNYHRRPKSQIHPVLQNSGIEYTCIFQP